MAAWIERERPTHIGEPELARIEAALGPFSSASSLRRLLRLCGVDLAPIVEGVRQESFESLEHSLLALLEEYERGGAARRTGVRKLVIEAKDHAKFAVNRNPAKKEMTLWMLTWLENPPLFREWLALRKRAGTG